MKSTCSIIKCALVLLLFSAFLSCSKDEVEKTKEKSLFLECDKGMTNDMDTVRTHIIGKYDWVYTFMQTRLSSGYSTPESSNSTLSYIFKDESKVEEYVNGALTNTYSYELKPRLVYLNNGETREEGSKLYFYDKEGEDRILKNIMFEYICNDSATFTILDSQTIMMQFTRNSL